MFNRKCFYNIVELLQLEFIMRAESERAGSLRHNHSTKNVKTIVPKYCNSKFSSTGYERAEKMIV